MCWFNNVLILWFNNVLILWFLARDLRDIQSRNSWVEADEVTFKDKLETKGDSDVSNFSYKIH